jgi:hypothetical protein
MLKGISRKVLSSGQNQCPPRKNFGFPAVEWWEYPGSIFLIQTFYHELKRTSREHIDTAAGGAFFSLQVLAPKELTEKMVANQDWDGDRLQPHTLGVH